MQFDTCSFIAGVLIALILFAILFRHALAAWLVAEKAKALAEEKSLKEGMNDFIKHLISKKDAVVSAVEADTNATTVTANGVVIPPAFVGPEQKS